MRTSAQDHAARVGQTDQGALTSLPHSADLTTALQLRSAGRFLNGIDNTLMLLCKCATTLPDGLTDAATLRAELAAFAERVVPLTIRMLPILQRRREILAGSSDELLRLYRETVVPTCREIAELTHVAMKVVPRIAQARGKRRSDDLPGFLPVDVRDQLEDKSADDAASLKRNLGMILLAAAEIGDARLVESAVADLTKIIRSGIRRHFGGAFSAFAETLADRLEVDGSERDVSRILDLLICEVKAIAFEERSLIKRQLHLAGALYDPQTVEGRMNDPQLQLALNHPPLKIGTSEPAMVTMRIPLNDQDFESQTRVRDAMRSLVSRLQGALTSLNGTVDFSWEAVEKAEPGDVKLRTCVLSVKFLAHAAEPDDFLQGIDTNSVPSTELKSAPTEPLHREVVDSLGIPFPTASGAVVGLSCPDTILEEGVLDHGTPIRTHLEELVALIPGVDSMSVQIPDPANIHRLDGKDEAVDFDSAGELGERDEDPDGDREDANDSSELTVYLGPDTSGPLFTLASLDQLRENHFLDRVNELRSACVEAATVFGMERFALDPSLVTISPKLIPNLAVSTAVLTDPEAFGLLKGILSRIRIGDFPATNILPESKIYLKGIALALDEILPALGPDAPNLHLQFYPPSASDEPAFGGPVLSPPSFVVTDEYGNALVQGIMGGSEERFKLRFLAEPYVPRISKEVYETMAALLASPPIKLKAFVEALEQRVTLPDFVVINLFGFVKSFEGNGEDKATPLLPRLVEVEVRRALNSVGGVKISESEGKITAITQYELPSDERPAFRKENGE